MKVIKVDGRHVVNKRTGLNFTCGVTFPRRSKGEEQAWNFSRVVISLLGESECLMPAWPGICRTRAPIMEKAGWTEYLPLHQDKTIYFLRKEDMEKSIALFYLTYS